MKRQPNTQIPERLQHIDFILAWEEWCAYRKARGKFTDYTKELQLRACNDMGTERAIAAIQYSIKQGWQGLFEPGDAQPRSFSTDPPPFQPMKPRRNQRALEKRDLSEYERTAILKGLKAIKLTIAQRE